MRLAKVDRTLVSRILGDGWEARLGSQNPPQAAIDTSPQSRNNITTKCFFESSASISSEPAESA